MLASCTYWRSCLRWVWLIPAFALLGTVSAQTPDPVQVYVPGEEVNLFSRWEGSETPESFFLELPAGWELESALAVRHGYHHIPFEIGPSGSYGIRIVAGGQLRGEFDIIVRARSAGYLPQQDVQWSVAPASYVALNGGGMYVPKEDFKFERRLRAAVTDASSHVLRLDGTQEPLLLSGEFTDRLRGSYTLEFWLRTTMLYTIVASSWDGQRDQLFELEMSIDGSGILRFYRNLTGDPIGMDTQIPVADGAWHHVAVSRDVESAWTRLFLDGTVTDSLYDPTAAGLYGASELAIGSGIVQTQRLFAGELDEVRLWSTARKSDEIMRGMWQHAPDDSPLVSVLRFEPEDNVDHLVPSARSLVLARGGPGITLVAPEFEGEVQEGQILLSWKSQHPLIREFMLERSADGCGI